MKQKNKKFLGKCFASVLLTLFFVVSFQASLLPHASFLQLSFDAASLVLEKNSFQEVRLTEHGNKIQRFFTGMAELPFVDYLIIEHNNLQSFVPIRDGFSLLTQNTDTTKELVGLLKNALPTWKNVLNQKILWISFLVLSLVQVLFVVKRSGFSLFAQLARTKLWLFHCSLRL